jgi:plexin A
MRVFIGSQNCNVTSLSSNQLTCKPPDSQPPALINGKEDYDELPEVVVQIGENLQYKIGKLSYSLGDFYLFIYWHNFSPPNDVCLMFG